MSPKTEAMVFKSKRDKNYEFAPMQLNDSQLHFCSEYQYLGHTIKDNLSDEEDIKRQIRQTYARGNLLINRFYMCSENVKTLLFRTYMSNFYSSQLWCKFPLIVYNNYALLIIMYLEISLA